MDDIFIFYKAILKVIKNFLLAVIFAVFGLTYIYLDEKRDKHKKRPFRKPLKRSTN